MKRLLRAFYIATGGKKPERLILFRGGVSEGMYPRIKMQELTQVIAACRELGRSVSALRDPVTSLAVLYYFMLC